MIAEKDIKLMVQQILTEIVSGEEVKKEVEEVKEITNNIETEQTGQRNYEKTVYEDGVIEDISALSLQEQFFVPDPVDKDGYLAMKKYTPARLGVWHAGTRYNTTSMLRFRADHGTAQDSVFNDVEESFVDSQGYIKGQSLCESRDVYLTRPDYGRTLDEASAKLFDEKIKKNQKVLIMVGDGLSSAAIGANVEDIIPALKQGLKAQGIEVGDIPFVKYCRVGAMDHMAEITGAEVICLLIGERPGLVTSESMSAYIAYKPTVNMPESRRTVVSNIHRGGTPPTEAGAHIAGILKTILDKKISGVELKL